MDRLERAQKSATTMAFFRGLGSVLYERRLRELALFRVQERFRGDLISIF